MQAGRRVARVLVNSNVSPLFLRHISTSSSGSLGGNVFGVKAMYRMNTIPESSIYKPMQQRVFYSSEERQDDSSVSEAVKEMYDKMQESIVEKRTAPPNAWLWSMISSCANVDDIKLLFDILQKFRVFRLSNLRIHENFNSALCQEITKACINVGAIDYAKKGLWKHNVYGLNPTIGSAHQLLLHAQKLKDAKLASDVMKLVKKNDLPLQPGTSDIVFSIWYDAENWNLISKYGKRFIKAGVKLRQNAFDIWMRFAAKRGDVDSLWKIEKFRSEMMKQHTLASGFSCAKGFLLERKPENAAAVIQLVNQGLSDTKRPAVMLELQQLISEWPLELLKHQKEGNKKALVPALQEDTAAMIEHLSRMGIKVNVKMEDFTKNEGVFS
ncbi:hypothetical protein LIER_06168 [Lithospermum erythrorhizon]|uniref:Adenylyl cyclase n=1 Tax=Lithospermum erythrorhizon TaxID=34254 RepID=A0AAV3P3A9_LITER